jgi:hypothetical protein
MGMVSSIPVDSTFESVSQWNFENCEDAIDTYKGCNFDYALNAMEMADFVKRMKIRAIPGTENCRWSTEIIASFDARHLYARKGVVEMMTFLCGAVACSSGGCSVADKANLIFDIVDYFDVDQIRQEELVILLQTTARGLMVMCGIGGFAKMPEHSILKEMAEQAFSACGLHRHGKMGKAEFQVWLKSVLGVLDLNEVDMVEVMTRFTVLSKKRAQDMKMATEKARKNQMRQKVRAKKAADAAIRAEQVERELRKSPKKRQASQRANNNARAIARAAAEAAFNVLALVGTMVEEEEDDEHTENM